MTDFPFDRAALRAYMARHKLKKTAMAAHAGIPYRTLLGVLRRYEPSPTTRAAIEGALQLAPPIRPMPRYAQDVTQAWPDRNTNEIGRKLGISHQRVSAIAKEIGLPPKRARHTVDAAE